MAQVFLHTHSPGNTDWNNELRDFVQVPNVGDYFALSFDSDWYKVELIVYCPFETTDSIEAEIYAVKVNQSEEMDHTLNV